MSEKLKSIIRVFARLGLDIRRITIMIKQLTRSVVLFIVFAMSFQAFGENLELITLESLIGKYEGVIQVVKAKAIKHPYQTEILSVDKSENTLSLSAYCVDCEQKEWKRTGCKITEVNENIRFICKGLTSDEVYIFNGMSLKATGFGNKYPYTIDVNKINKCFKLL
jgi:hypothetical protein